MRLRKYNAEDSKIICSWVRDKKMLFQWSADRIGKFPLQGNELNENYASCRTEVDFFPLTAVDEDGSLMGHLFIRIPDESCKTVVRFGFVIVSPELRGAGNGKRMLELAMDFAKKELDATKVTLGVFANNPDARHCYEAAGFVPVSTRSMNILDEDWECIEMEKEL